jgi:hypothetical protein
MRDLSGHEIVTIYEKRILCLETTVSGETIVARLVELLFTL